MLIHPSRTNLTTFPGTRVIASDFGLGRFSYAEKKNPNRVWFFYAALLPLASKPIKGIRIELRDQKGFTTFINQRDLEVLLELGVPGTRCEWCGGTYREVDGEGWIGLFGDFDDWTDVLQREELNIRAQQQGGLLLPGQEIVLNLYDGARDYCDLMTVLTDTDKDGLSPDTKITTIHKRWSRIERTPVNWADMPYV